MRPVTLRMCACGASARTRLSTREWLAIHRADCPDAAEEDHRRAEDVLEREREAS